MTPRVVTLIEKLELKAHPEGGYFREVFRSSESVRLVDRRLDRSAITTIYYLLPGGTFSRWHRVTSDEIWHFYEGDPLELFCIDPELRSLHRCVLGPLSEVSEPVRIIQAGNWQAARPLGHYSLVGCSVGPGFDFEDFQLLTDSAEECREVELRFPEVAALL